ncbi:hypothetical protein EVAR_2238_1 [Eumeta japonica]|uniref:Uncharacterized protein n=1 Tax=Eumeta variegata TaxID=151549 RepID=A0A4C1SFQ0_EUMVA|nr:hypothetical protein EVAR_2238_1 [Eumeta japonica]
MFYATLLPYIKKSLSSSDGAEKKHNFSYISRLQTELSKRAKRTHGAPKKNRSSILSTGGPWRSHDLLTTLYKHIERGMYTQKFGCRGSPGDFTRRTRGRPSGPGGLRPRDI